MRSLHSGERQRLVTLRMSQSEALFFFFSAMGGSGAQLETHFVILLPPRCQFNDAVRSATPIFAIKFKVPLPRPLKPLRLLQQ